MDQTQMREPTTGLREGGEECGMGNASNGSRGGECVCVVGVTTRKGLPIDPQPPPAPGEKKKVCGVCVCVFLKKVTARGGGGG